ncbi:MAG: TerB family tellurite resistance protein [Hyphomicrobiaceae bacterium]
MQAQASAEGGTIRQILSVILSAFGLGDGSKGRRHRAAFTAAVVALAAKLSKSDGVALKIEEQVFEHRFPVDESEVGNVRWLYRLAAQDVAGFETYAREVAAALENESELRKDIFEALLHIATADDVMHEAEDRYLSIVAGIFGYSDLEFRAMRARFVHDASDPYIILGISHDASNTELKAHYLKLVRENHPDTLAAKGLARELGELADRKLASINAAWEEIARERGL